MSVPQTFRTYDLSIQFYRECKQIKLPHSIKDQLQRAASSITLTADHLAASRYKLGLSALTCGPSRAGHGSPRS